MIFHPSLRRSPYTDTGEWMCHRWNQSRKERAREMSMRQCGRLLIALAMAMMLAAPTAMAISAHAEYRSSTPANGATVATAPQQVVITFSQETSATKSNGVVTNTAGTVVSTGWSVDLNERDETDHWPKPNSRQRHLHRQIHLPIGGRTRRGRLIHLHRGPECGVCRGDDCHEGWHWRAVGASGWSSSSRAPRSSAAGCSLSARACDRPTSHPPNRRNHRTKRPRKHASVMD